MINKKITEKEFIDKFTTSVKKADVFDETKVKSIVDAFKKENKDVLDKHKEKIDRVIKNI